MPRKLQQNDKIPNIFHATCLSQTASLRAIVAKRRDYMGWEGDSKGRGYIYTYSWFILLYNTVKQLYSNLKKNKSCHRSTHGFILPRNKIYVYYLPSWEMYMPESWVWCSANIHHVHSENISVSAQSALFNSPLAIGIIISKHPLCVRHLRQPLHIHLIPCNNLAK